MAKILLILGIDGLDYSIVETMFAKGELPNLRRIADSGSFGPFATVWPPQSPVAWSTIATGENPGTHGIFDFIHRNPSDYSLRTSLLRRTMLRYEYPMRGKTFWEKAGERRIRSTILRWPAVFPPRKIRGNILAGLGVPDLLGSQGTYTVITSITIDHSIKGTVRHVGSGETRIKTSIAGPVVSGLGGNCESLVPLEVEIGASGIACNIGGEVVSLAPGEWSGHVPVQFGLGFMAKARGYVRLHLKSVHPYFHLYVSPVHPAPGSVAFPISAPLEYSKDLQTSLGSYATLGMSEDTNALNDRMLDEDAFLNSTFDICAERERMLMHGIGQSEAGILACVFDTLDRIQHMFWRHHEARGVSGSDEQSVRYGNVIWDAYEKIDRIIGRAVEAAGGDATVVVCSDHGFSSYATSVHLNSFLVEKGYMTLKNQKPAGAGLLKDVDWSASTAYGVGLNSIYLNRAGREGQGIVPEAETIALKERLTHDLLSLRDGNGAPVVLEVKDGRDIFSGGEAEKGPDLLVGYNRSFRTSPQSALGEVPGGPVLETNTMTWSGDHCCAPQLVPGVFFGSEKALAPPPEAVNFAPALLDYLGVRSS